MNKQISEAEERAKGYKYIDGTYEFKVGLTVLILTVNTIVQTRLNGGGFGNILLLLISLVLIVGGGWLIDRSIVILKERVTFRRSGYVSFDQKKRQEYPADTIILFVILVFLIVPILSSWLQEILTTKWMPILPALVISVVTGIAAYRSSQRRFYVLAATNLLAGITLALVNNGRWDLPASGAIYFALMSLIFLSAGAFTLWNYLRKTQTVEENPSGN